MIYTSLAVFCTPRRASPVLLEEVYEEVLAGLHPNVAPSQACMSLGDGAQFFGRWVMRAEFSCHWRSSLPYLMPGFGVVGRCGMRALSL